MRSRRRMTEAIAEVGRLRSRRRKTDGRADAGSLDGILRVDCLGLRATCIARNHIYLRVAGNLVLFSYKGISTRNNNAVI